MRVVHRAVVFAQHLSPLVRYYAVVHIGHELPQGLLEFLVHRLRLLRHLLKR